MDLDANFLLLKALSSFHVSQMLYICVCVFVCVCVCVCVCKKYMLDHMKTNLINSNSDSFSFAYSLSLVISYMTKEISPLSFLYLCSRSYLKIAVGFLVSTQVSEPTAEPAPETVPIITTLSAAPLIVSAAITKEHNRDTAM